MLLGLKLGLVIYFKNRKDLVWFLVNDWNSEMGCIVVIISLGFFLFRELIVKRIFRMKLKLGIIDNCN